MSHATRWKKGPNDRGVKKTFLNFIFMSKYHGSPRGSHNIHPSHLGFVSI